MCPPFTSLCDVINITTTTVCVCVCVVCVCVCVSARLRGQLSLGVKRSSEFAPHDEHVTSPSLCVSPASGDEKLVETSTMPDADVYHKCTCTENARPSRKSQNLLPCAGGK